MTELIYLMAYSIIVRPLSCSMVSVGDDPRADELDLIYTCLVCAIGTGTERLLLRIVQG